MKDLKTLMASAVAALALTAGGAAQATTINLTSKGATDTIGGATYTQVDAQPTGSGIIDSFVRIRDNQPTVQGYNTTVSGTYQNDGTNTFNHQITVGEVGFLEINGQTVMRFLLDINQTASDPFLLLSEVQIFLTSSPNQSNEDPLNLFELAHLANSFLVYQMDAGQTDNGALLNYKLNMGSGSGDMILDIPVSMFTSAWASLGLTTDAQKNSAFIYLYSKFEGNNDGYEEWTHYQGNPFGQPPCVPTPEIPCTPNFIPEPNSLLLFGLGLLGSAIVVRRGRRWS